MDLLEYQVKEWFSKIGIPVLPSQRLNHPTDLKRLKIPYPIVLKSQVYGGERAKAGGVRFAETTIDAIAAAQTIFNIPIWGELPDSLLAESLYNATQEYYLAVVLDTAVCRPVLLGSTEKGIDWESAGEKMQYVVVEQDFSPFYARRLALKMGLQGRLMESVSLVVEKMYQLFIQKDLDLVEINPLAVSASDEVMALNGKVSINERAIGRHPELSEIALKMANRRSREIQIQLGYWDNVDLQGKIGILANGTGSMMATVDLVTSAGGKVGSCINLRHALLTDVSPTTFCDRLNKSLNIFINDKSFSVILINLLGSVPEPEQLAAVMAGVPQPEKVKTQPPVSNTKGRRQSHLPSIVLRIVGSEYQKVKEFLDSQTATNELLTVVEDLEAAATIAVNLTQENSYTKE